MSRKMLAWRMSLCLFFIRPAFCNQCCFTVSFAETFQSQESFPDTKGAQKFKSGKKYGQWRNEGAIWHVRCVPVGEWIRYEMHNVNRPHVRRPALHCVTEINSGVKVIK